jgi:hypothetical protein
MDSETPVQDNLASELGDMTLTGSQTSIQQSEEPASSDTTTQVQQADQDLSIDVRSEFEAEEAARRNWKTAGSLAMSNIVGRTFNSIHPINHTKEGHLRDCLDQWHDNPGNLGAAKTVVPYMISKTQCSATFGNYSERLAATWAKLEEGDLDKL